MKVPTEYIAYSEDLDSIIEGLHDGPPGYFALWPPNEIEQRNRDLEVAGNAPGFLGFGSNGGGELLAFDAAGAVYMLPMIGMCPKDAIKVSDSWEAFVAQITPDA